MYHFLFRMEQKQATATAIAPFSLSRGPNFELRRLVWFVRPRLRTPQRRQSNTDNRDRHNNQSVFVFAEARRIARLLSSVSIVSWNRRETDAIYWKSCAMCQWSASGLSEVWCCAVQCRYIRAVMVAGRAAWGPGGVRRRATCHGPCAPAGAPRRARRSRLPSAAGAHVRR